jgi:hypothetical protein
MLPVRIVESNGVKKQIGYVEDDGNWFITVRETSRHLYRGGTKSVGQAIDDGTASWGIDAKACDGMIAKDITYIKIITNIGTYTGFLRDFKDNPKAFALHHKPHRAQYFLPLSEFTYKSGQDEYKSALTFE